MLFPTVLHSGYTGKYPKPVVIVKAPILSSSGNPTEGLLERTARCAEGAPSPVLNDYTRSLKP